MSNPDSYYSRTEVSNSDLTELKNYLYPRVQYGDKEKAFKFGTLVDALITENDRVRYDKLMVDDYVYTQEEFELGLEMRRALRKEAEKDQFLAVVLTQSDTQRFMVNRQQEFYYGNFAYHLDTRCKWDWWLSAFNFGGDLKTTFAESQAQFDEAIDFSIGIVPVPGIWILQEVNRISFMQSQKRIAKYSSILSPIVAILHISEGKRNTRTLLSNGGN